jgi:hypothetical protein
MLTTDQLKCAIVMIGRAPCKGEEAPAVTSTLQALTSFYNTVVDAEKQAAAQEDNDGDDAGSD